MDREMSGPQRRRWSDGGTAAVDTHKPWSMGDQWPVVVGSLAGEQLDFVRAVSALVQQSTAEGRMTEAEAAVLRSGMARLQHTSMRGQQITRLASGRIRQFRESIDLSQVVRA